MITCLFLGPLQSPPRCLWHALLCFISLVKYGPFVDQISWVSLSIFLIPNMCRFNPSRNLWFLSHVLRRKSCTGCDLAVLCVDRHALPGVGIGCLGRSNRIIKTQNYGPPLQTHDFRMMTSNVLKTVGLFVQATMQLFTNNFKHFSMFYLGFHLFKHCCDKNSAYQLFFSYVASGFADLTLQLKESRRKWTSRD